MLVTHYEYNDYSARSPVLLPARVVGGYTLYMHDVESPCTSLHSSFTTGNRRVIELHRVFLKLKHLVPRLRARDRLLVMEDTILNAGTSVNPALLKFRTILTNAIEHKSHPLSSLLFLRHYQVLITLGTHSRFKYICMYRITYLCPLTMHASLAGW
jgi:hypothetical protein